MIVPWDQVRDHMHVDSGWRQEKKEKQAEKRDSRTGKKQPEEKADFREAARAYEASEKELREIFERTYRTGEREEARIAGAGGGRPAERALPPEKMPFLPAEGSLWKNICWWTL